MADRRGAALHRLRGTHEAAVLAEVRRSGALTRADLIDRLGLSRTTVFAIVSDLLAREALVEQPKGAPGGRGRPAMTVGLNPRGAQLVGIGLLPDRLRIVVANHAHEVVARCGVPLPYDAGPDARVAAVVAAVGGLAAAREVSLAPVAGVGLGLPGPVRRRDERDPAADAPAVARIVAELGRHFGVPVLTDNNTRLAALAETTWGAARGLSDVVYLRWSQGVGGGLVIGGRPVRGAHGAAGEIGHTSCDPRGPRCHCGGRGCLEGVIALPALLERCRERGGTARDTGELLALATSGDPLAAGVVREAAVAAGRVLAGLAAQTDPECVVVAGEVAGLGESVLGVIREQLATLSLPGSARAIAVVPSALGDDAAALGAVAMLLRAVGEDAGTLTGR